MPSTRWSAAAKRYDRRRFRGQIPGGLLMADRFKNLIDGKWVEAKSGKTFDNRNPANRNDLIGLFPASGQQDVDDAVRSAKHAFAKWRLVPAPKRGEMLYRVGELLRQRKEEIARIMTREMGKILKETRGDVQEGIDTAFYTAGEGRRLFGETTASELPDKFAMSVRAPVGVCALITPWNFPMAIPTWKLFPALLCGNTAVLKPAEDTPHTAVKLFGILEEAGIPPGVVNLVHGRGEEAGAALLRHSDVKLVSFTGSAAVGREIASACGENLKRVSLELGGKNAQIVMEDADLDLALEGARWGAFGTTGQRCTATSRLILHKKSHDEFVDRLVARVKKLKLGNGLDESNEVGPLVNRGRVDAVDAWVKIGSKEGKVLCGGEPAVKGTLGKGCFYEPTVIDGVKPT